MAIIQSYSGLGAIGPVPTPKVPAGVSYTPQGSGYDPFAGAYSVQRQSTPPVVAPKTSPFVGTQSTSQTTNTSGGGSPSAPVPAPAPTPSGPSPEEQARIDAENRLRGEIEGGYSDYFSQLDAIMNEGLAGQRTAQEGIIGNQYTAGVGDLRTQEQAGLTNLGAEEQKATTNQAKNLRDLASNIRNMFMTGNVYLGSRGAGDSSAANQYSYALSKLGSQQRGNVMAQTSDILADIGRRTTTLKQTVANELQKLADDRDNKILEVSNWFNEQQNALRQMKAQGALAKSQDLQSLSKQLLSSALNRLAMVDQEATNKRSMLDQWAISNAKNISQLKANLAQVGSPQYASPQAGMISGTPTVDSAGNMNTRVAVGYGSSPSSTRYDIFGNPIA